MQLYAILVLYYEIRLSGVEHIIEIDIFHIANCLLAQVTQSESATKTLYDTLALSRWFCLFIEWDRTKTHVACILREHQQTPKRYAVQIHHDKCSLKATAILFFETHTRLWPLRHRNAVAWVEENQKMCVKLLTGCSFVCR